MTTKTKNNSNTTNSTASLSTALQALAEKFNEGKKQNQKK
jgi:hypothetical protein